MRGAERMSKKLPVGIENFEEFSSQDFYYVDKTMFIAEFLDSWGKVNLFTRPRRFGKTLILSMLKAFFEIGCDKTLFDGLKISQERELCEKYMGQYPVISVTLKSVDGLSFQSACAALRGLIGKEALRFGFLADSDRLSSQERAMYLQLIDVGSTQNAIFTMTDAMLVESLHTLTQLLARHFGRKVILLIDEYDVPLEKAFQAGYYEEMVSLIRSLFGNVLKSNDSLHFAVLTGCLRISKESIFTGLNNLNVMTITDPYFNDSFGFTEQEVKELLSFYGQEDAFETIQEWYDGYQFGGRSVYCPWDVARYVQALLKDRNAVPRNYWANTSGNAMIRRFIGKAGRETKNEMERLIAGESIVKPVNQELTYSELDHSIENLWSVLFTTGYLTQNGRPDLADGVERYSLRIPNREIRSLFISQIREWFNETARADVQKLERFCQAFLDGDAALIEEMMNAYLWNSISIRDIAVSTDRKENFYHGMLLGLLQYETEWGIKSNAESGEGYSDILIQTPQRIGVVIETKYAQDGNLEKGCAAALEQIERKRYDAALIKDGMKKIVKYGIAFCKKNCKAEVSRRV